MAIFKRAHQKRDDANISQNAVVLFIPKKKRRGGVSEDKTQAKANQAE